MCLEMHELDTVHLFSTLGLECSAALKRQKLN